MKKLFVLFAFSALVFSSCRVDELDSLNYEKIREEKKETKKDKEFEMFNDRYQTNAEWRKKDY